MQKRFHQSINIAVGPNHIVFAVLSFASTILVRLGSHLLHISLYPARVLDVNQFPFASKYRRKFACFGFASFMVLITMKQLQFSGIFAITLPDLPVCAGSEHKISQIARTRACNIGTW